MLMDVSRLEQYSWRDRETKLNTTLPQFRTAIKVPGSNIPLRIHFLHIRSSHTHAVPLLLIPSFPLTNLSLAPLFAHLTDPSSPTSMQPFHLVVPSIPGLGFSDAFNAPDSSMLTSTAEVFNTLMTRLGYEYYLASGTGSGKDSPGGIDYHLVRLVGERFPENCLGVHLIAPPLQQPRLEREPWMWTKFVVAKFFHASIFGYEAEDFTALRESQNVAKQVQKSGDETSTLMRKGAAAYGAVGMVGLREPNTFAYALCDSPVGLLSLVCSALRKKSPQHQLSNTEIVDVTQLAWLPGPEAGARFWAGAVKEVEILEKENGSRARVALTVFGSDGRDGEPYSCPAWGCAKHDVLFAQRAPGRAGLVSWERADVVFEGIRGLAREVERVDGRLKARTLEEVVIPGEETIREEDEDEGHELQLDAESPDTVVAVEIS